MVRRRHGPFAQILRDFVIARCRQREKGLPIDASDGQNKVGTAGLRSSGSGQDMKGKVSHINHWQSIVECCNVLGGLGTAMLTPVFANLH